MDAQPQSQFIAVVSHPKTIFPGLVTFPCAVQERTGEASECVALKVQTVLGRLAAFRGPAEWVRSGAVSGAYETELTVPIIVFPIPADIGSSQPWPLHSRCLVTAIIRVYKGR